MFCRLFVNLLESDINRLLQGKTGEHTPRHRRGIASPGISAKHQHSVPVYKQVDGSLNPKVERLRDQPFGEIVLNDVDVKDIVNRYNIKDLSADKPRQLSNTGMTIQFNNRLNSYVLVK